MGLGGVGRRVSHHPPPCLAAPGDACPWHPPNPCTPSRLWVFVRRQGHDVPHHGGRRPPPGHVGGQDLPPRPHAGRDVARTHRLDKRLAVQKQGGVWVGGGGAGSALVVRRALASATWRFRSASPAGVGRVLHGVRVGGQGGWMAREGPFKPGKTALADPNQLFNGRNSKRTREGLQRDGRNVQPFLTLHPLHAGNVAQAPGAWAGWERGRRAALRGMRRLGSGGYWPPAPSQARQP